MRFYEFAEIGEDLATALDIKSRQLDNQKKAITNRKKALANQKAKADNRDAVAKMATNNRNAK